MIDEVLRAWPGFARAYEVSSTMKLSSGIEKAASSKEREVAERGKKI
jgi:hypothetical protein